MKNLERELITEKFKTEELLTKVNNEIKTLKPDEARIKASFTGSTLQLYIKESANEYKDGRYLSVTEKDRAENIVKSEYLNKAKLALEKRLKLLEKTIIELKNTNISNVYKKMGKGKQSLIEPLEITDEEYRRKWEECEYKGKPFIEGAVEIYTDRGERVRSKSEKIIADKLYKENIAYRYEYPFTIADITMYPDFTILDEINRREIILEHFGLMDNEEYVNNALSKIQIYASGGYVLGDNLYITMETALRPMDSRILGGIIKKIKKEGT